ncbi:hypothetical protein [Cyanobacterium sp. uoEpiScrs1]|uniref:hypothetical protein n=1 Tax=Cyanobacterium sp. uoEpiScrs1 TaxID=2976343 RepID=UPI002269C0BF|nr:hypothetical protein [Cyanobacterium sp. uoEpiScrs1]
MGLGSEWQSNGSQDYHLIAVGVGFLYYCSLSGSELDKCTALLVWVHIIEVKHLNADTPLQVTIN